MKIILPKTLCRIDPNYGPLFFLAGPVLGADDWQAECCNILRKHIPHFYAALPCRYAETHPLFQFRMKGKENHFDRQTTWERYYLELAAQRVKKAVSYSGFLVRARKIRALMAIPTQWTRAVSSENGVGV